MRSFKIDSKTRIVRIVPSRKFFGANSLLSLKITSIPYEHTNRSIIFHVTYGNDATDITWSINVLFDPPYYFNAVTPNLSHMQPQISFPEFSWIEIKPNDNYNYKIEVSFNTNLHRDLDPFRKSAG
jgi:hypothetical protein